MWTALRQKFAQSDETWCRFCVRSFCCLCAAATSGCRSSATLSTTCGTSSCSSGSLLLWLFRHSRNHFKCWPLDPEAEVVVRSLCRMALLACASVRCLPVCCVHPTTNCRGDVHSFRFSEVGWLMNNFTSLVRFCAPRFGFVVLMPWVCALAS